MGLFGRFFQGRNGTDQLNMAIFIASMVLTVLGRGFLPNIFSTLAYVLLFCGMFRMVSRNIPKRQRENAMFLQIVSQLRTRERIRKQKPKKDRANFRYFHCPKCNCSMRAPRGKGKIRVTCAQCNTVFTKKV